MNEGFNEINYKGKKMERVQDPVTKPKEIKVKLVKAKTFELDPSKKYLLCIDSRALACDQAEDLLNCLEHYGINAGVALLINGDPNKVIRIIEDTNEPNLPNKDAKTDFTK